MPNFKSISFKMAVLQGAGRICPPHVCVIQKTPCGIRLINTDIRILCWLDYFKRTFSVQINLFINSTDLLHILTLSNLGGGAGVNPPERGTFLNIS